ncbi:hypothetical protein H4R34_001944 [Dimargaris verticillata]|uniref:Carrier domain-containing protein n=1 Tax=Dimargaris verticillata TaxID=2761393 RepID=A0A9W8B7G6_9FUNG|nr:hypothetical protein H4R34_001944 [Dimargaris verticillata]
MSPITPNINTPSTNGVKVTVAGSSKAGDSCKHGSGHFANIPLSPKGVAYWTEQLANVAWDLNLPDDRCKILPPTAKLGTSHTTFSLQICEALGHYATAHHSLPATAILTTLSLYLSRITGQSQFALGVVVPDGASSTASSMPGEPILPLCVDCSSHVSVATLLNDLRRQTQDAIRYGQPALDEALRQLGLSGRLDQHTLYPVTVRIAHGTSVEPRRQPAEFWAWAKVGVSGWLHFDFCQTKTALAVAISYQTDRFSEALIASLISGWESYTTAILASGADPWTAPLTSPMETERIQNEWSLGDVDSAGPWATVGNVMDVLSEHAQCQPDILALDTPVAKLTYHSLLPIVCAVAQAMADQGIQPQTRVGVVVGRNHQSVITFLALWHLGAVYVPIDVSLPIARQEFICTTAQCKYTINSACQATSLPNAIPYVTLTAKPTAERTATVVRYRFQPNDLAYIIFTSGTTGTPKGVPIRHAGLVNVLAKDYTQLVPHIGTRIFQGYAMGFDASIYIIMLSLYHCYTVVLSDADPTVGLSQVESASITPSVLASLDPAHYPNLRRICLGGEAVPQALIRKWHTGRLVINGYGPTEATVFTLITQLSSDQRVTVGRPIANTSCYILDQAQHIVPAGVVGEIYIGGVAVSPGYLGKPELTATRFIPNPFGSGLLYATGDLGRWLRNGHVECLGRADEQVKLRGYRIELDEVCNTVLAQANVQDVAVLVQGTQLVAFVSPSTVDDRQLHRALVSHLPQYMVPSHILRLQGIPKTYNGKVDKRALGDMFKQYEAQLRAVASTSPKPDTPLMSDLRLALASVLSLVPAEINLDLSFIQLGGDSINAIQLTAEMRRSGYKLAVPTLLQRKPLRSIASLVEAVPDTSSLKLSSNSTSAGYPLSPMQRWLLQISKSQFETMQQWLLIQLAQPTNCDTLAMAMHQVIQKHALLNSQVIPGEHVSEFYLQPLPTNANRFQVANITCALSELPDRLGDVQQQLDVYHGPLIRVARVQVTNSTLPCPYLFITISRMVIDAASWSAILIDLGRSLQGFVVTPAPLAIPDWKFEPTALTIPECIPSPVPCHWRFNNLTSRLATTCHRLVNLLPALCPEHNNQALGRMHVCDVFLAAFVQGLQSMLSGSSLTIWFDDPQRQSFKPKDSDLPTVSWLSPLYPVTISLDGSDDLVSLLLNVKQAQRLAKQHSSSLVHTYLYDANNVVGTKGVLFSYRDVTIPAELGCAADWTALAQPPITKPAPTPWSLALQVSLTANDTFVLQATHCLPPTLVDHLLDTLQASATRIAAKINRMAAQDLWIPMDFPWLQLSGDELCGLKRALSDQGIAPENVQAIYPLHPNAQGMLTATAKRASDYTNQITVTIQGVDCAQSIYKALAAVFARHDALRSRFLMNWTSSMATGAQVILTPTAQVGWTVAQSWLEFGASSEAEFLDANETRGFVVDGPMVRAALVPIARLQWRLIIAVHHAVMDGWSYGLFIQAFLQALQSQPQHNASAVLARSSLEPFMASYAARRWAASQQFWYQYLGSSLPATLLELPPDEPTDGMRYATYRSQLWLDCAQLRAALQAHGLTIHCLLTATWALVLQAYTNQDTVVFGNTVSGRSIEVPGIDQTLGCLVNAVPVCVGVNIAVSVGEFLEGIHDTLASLRPHEDCHISQIQRWTDPSLDVYGLYNTLLVYQNFPFELHTATHGQVKLEELAIRGSTEYDCSVSVEPAGDGLETAVTWNGQKFGRPYMVQLVKHFAFVFQWLIQSLDQQPGDQRKLCELPELPSSHLAQLKEFGHKPLAMNTNTTVVAEFSTMARQYPHHVAVEHGDTRWSYTELFQQVSRISFALHTLQLAPDEPIGILVRRIPDTIAALLGILAARAAFVHLDPDFPMERIAFMVRDCGIRYVLYHPGDEQLAQLVRTQCAVTLLSLVSLQESMPTVVTADLPTDAVQPNDLAYILYTSGSTGRPKGVMIEHRGLANLVQQPSALTGIVPGVRFMQTLSLSFDASLYDIFVTLCSGATLVLRQEITDTLTLVNMTKITPSLLAVLVPSDYPNLDRLVIGGEPLPAPLAQQWAGHCTLQYSYGPTECTITATTGIYEPQRRVTLGSPYYNVELFILSPQQRPVPLGVPGEVYIGGPGVMRGYVGRPDLDAAVLVDCPFGATSKLYKTGDRARWLADGEIEHLGRLDDQIKLHGRRIELREIETVLLRYPGVIAASVIVAKQRLLAFVSPAPLAIASVTRFLGQHLPLYMVPQHIIPLATLPVTPNGKVDKKALVRQVPLSDPQPRAADIAVPQPNGPVETILVEAMAKTLACSVAIIDPTVSFFAMGGDSLLAIRLASQCRDRGIRLSIAQIFQSPTARGLALLHEQSNTRQPASLEAPLLYTVPPFSQIPWSLAQWQAMRMVASQTLQVSSEAIVDILPASPLQAELLANTTSHPATHMVQSSYRITGPLDVARYQACWTQVSQRHSILRTKFMPVDRVTGTAYVQVVLPTMDVVWSCDLEPRPLHPPFEQQQFTRDRHHRFTLNGEPLLRLALYRQDPTHHVLFFTFHHALLEAWSVNLVLDEVMTLYHGLPLPPALQFGTLLAHIDSQPFAPAQRFWRSLMLNARQTPDLAWCDPLPGAPHTRPYEATSIVLDLPLSTLQTYCRNARITLNSLLRGAWALCLSKYVDSPPELTFGVLLSGRNVPLAGISRVVGLCINAVPFRVKLDATQCFTEWLGALHRLSGEIMAHEHVNLRQIHEWAAIPSTPPLFQSLLVYNKYRGLEFGAQDKQGIRHQFSQGIKVAGFPLTVSFYDQEEQDALQMALTFQTARDIRLNQSIFHTFNALVHGIVTATEQASLGSVIQQAAITVPEPL